MLACYHRHIAHQIQYTDSSDFDLLHLAFHSCGSYVFATAQKQHVNYVQTVLRLQFPNLDGLQSILYQSHSQGFKANACMLQVIHSCVDHWIVATTMQGVPGEVRVFDWVYTSRDDGTYQTIQRWFGCHTSPFQVTIVNKPKQQEGSDCGVFSIASSLYLPCNR